MSYSGRFATVIRVEIGEDSTVTYGSGASTAEARGRVVAHKKFEDADESQITHWRNEIRLLKNLKHKNVIKMHKWWADCDADTKINLWIELDWYDWDMAALVDKHIDNEIVISKSQFKFISESIWNGLSYIHNCGIIHCDISTGNILVNTTLDKLVICDFGSSVKIRDSKNHDRYIGTPQYMAPEIILRRAVSKGTDVWSAAVILYELIEKDDVFCLDYDSDSSVPYISDSRAVWPHVDQIREIVPTLPDPYKICLSWKASDRPSTVAARSLFEKYIDDLETTKNYTTILV